MNNDLFFWISVLALITDVVTLMLSRKKPSETKEKSCKHEKSEESVKCGIDLYLNDEDRDIDLHISFHEHCDEKNPHPVGQRDEEDRKV